MNELHWLFGKRFCSEVTHTEQELTYADPQTNSSKHVSKKNFPRHDARKQLMTCDCDPGEPVFQPRCLCLSGHLFVNSRWSNNMMSFSSSSVIWMVSEKARFVTLGIQTFLRFAFCNAKYVQMGLPSPVRCERVLRRSIASTTVRTASVCILTEALCQRR